MTPSSVDSANCGYARPSISVFGCAGTLVRIQSSQAGAGSSRVRRYPFASSVCPTAAGTELSVNGPGLPSERGRECFSPQLELQFDLHWHACRFAVETVWLVAPSGNRI